MAIGCLYCGLQLPDTAEFCPECGRLIERGFEIRPIQESELDCLRKEMKRKDDLLRQQRFCYAVEASSRVGRAMKKVDPCSSADLNQMRPPCRSMSSRQR